MLRRIFRRRSLPLWEALLYAIAAGFVLCTAFAPFHVWVAAPIAVAALFMVLRRRRAASNFLLGLAFGLAFYVPLVSWSGTYLGVVPWLALAGVEAFITALVAVVLGWAARWVPRAVTRPHLATLAVATVYAALWVGGEVVIGTWPYGGFPWARLGIAVSESPWVQTVSWVGISGLSFAIAWCTVFIAETVRRGGIRWPLRAAVGVAVAVVLALVPAFPTTSSGTMTVAAVQGNGPSGYFDDREQYSVIDAQLAATEPLYGEDVDVVIWPEGGVEYDPFQDAGTARRLTAVANRFDAPLLANSATARGELYFNTSMLWLPDGTAEQTVAKHHPVPFGEYVPDRAFFNALAPDLIGLLQRDYTPGTGTPTVEIDGVALGLAICFDVIYDDVITAGVTGGAEALVFQTNNADFRGSVENLQQLAIARLRAIETGRTVVNISTIGTSQIIRPDGSTQASLNVDEAGAMLETIERHTGLTAGVVLGPWIQQFLLWGGLLSLAVCGVISRRRR